MTLAKIGRKITGRTSDVTGVSSPIVILHDFGIYITLIMTKHDEKLKQAAKNPFNSLNAS